MFTLGDEVFKVGDTISMRPPGDALPFIGR